MKEIESVSDRKIRIERHHEHSEENSAQQERRRQDHTGAVSLNAR